MNAASITIYHNPECGTSRNTLALIRASGLEPEVIEYLKTPPSRDMLQSLIARAGVPVRDLMRTKGTPFRQLGLDAPEVTDDALVGHMLAHPILINRPLVVTARGVKLCRPSDLVLDLLPQRPAASFVKEDGSPILLDRVIDALDPGLQRALEEASLPTADLPGQSGSFHAYETLDGQPAGYGGFEQYGTDALLRSIVVPPARRGSGIGAGLLALLMRRAFDQGARKAWLMTTSAGPFFERNGFTPVERAQAPQAILDTPQAKGLCPASALLLARSITL